MMKRVEAASVALAAATLLLAVVFAEFVPQTLAQTADPAKQPWLRLAAFPVPSEELLGASANGKLYVFAGLAPGWKPRALVYEYDPATDKWTEKKPMALPSHHVAFVSLDDKIYAFGGFVLPASGPTGWTPIDNAWEYDPAADSWKALAPMPSKRGAAAAAAIDGKIYVVGGAGLRPGSTDTMIHPARPHQVVGTVEEYDPATNSWRTRSPMPTPRNHHAVAAANGRIYAIGGRIGAAFITRASNTDVVEAYDPAADTWSAPLERMPTPRSAVASGVHNGRIYVAGGEFQDRRMLGAFRAVESYDAASNSWAILPSMPQPRHGLAGGVIGDRLHLVSGDVQSAGTGAHVDMDEHDALRLELVER
jgi:N-acetylneuraminic acid mutarotase